MKFGEAEYVEEDVLISSPVDEVMKVLKDPLNVPLWSMNIKAVTLGMDGIHTGYTSLGPVYFSWNVDEGGRKIIMTSYIMGYEIESYFIVEEEENSVRVRALWPVDPDIDEHMLDAVRESGKEELLKLKKLIEGRKI